MGEVWVLRELGVQSCQMSELEPGAKTRVRMCQASELKSGARARVRKWQKQNENQKPKMGSGCAGIRSQNTCQNTPESGAKATVKTRDLIDEVRKCTRIRSIYLSLCIDRILQTGPSL